MKILFFTASVNIGGIERVFLSYATGLMAKGHNIHYVSCRENGDWGMSIPDNLQLHCLGNVRLRYSVLRLRKLLMDVNPDVIITGNDSTLVVFLARIMLFRKKNKIVTSQHSYYNNNETLFYTKPILKYIFPKCDKVIAVSTGIADMLKKDFNMVAPLVKVINNPIDIKNVDINSQKRLELNIPSNYVTFVGRMTPVKNLKFLLDSFEFFIKKQKDFYLIMVGDGYSRNELEEYVKIKRLQSKVLFVGVQPNPYPLIANSRLLLLPSLSEAYPTVLIEAMRLGITCVCTPTLGAMDILENGKYGYISKTFNDEVEFAQRMEHALYNNIDSELLYNHVEMKYSLDSKVNELLHFINL